MEVSLFVSSQMSNPLFDNYFLKQYHGRWKAIKQSLLKPERQILRPNLFTFQSPSAFGLEECDFLPNCYWRAEAYTLKKNESGFYDYYIMDPASAIVAYALDAQPGEIVLDMCAAPGGKSLIIAEQMRKGTLISNEISENRRDKLITVFQDYISKDQRMFITVKGLDANLFGLKMPNHFDRTLLDAPCSGERHLLENSKEFLLWTEKRTKNLSIRQYSLLSAAWLSTKPLGRIVYSTCSISHEENDAVVAKLVKKRKPKVLRPAELAKYSFIEPTEYGYRILPDNCGFGPMYFSVLEKQE